MDRSPRGWPDRSSAVPHPRAIERRLRPCPPHFTGEPSDGCSGQANTRASVSQTWFRNCSATSPARLRRSAVSTGATSRQQKAVASGKTPGARSTSSGHPRRLVVPGTTNTLLSRRFMLSADTTSTGRNFVPALAHQISPRRGDPFVTHHRQGRPTRQYFDC